MYSGVHKSIFKVYSNVTLKSKNVFWTKKKITLCHIILPCLKSVCTHLSIIKVKQIYNNTITSTMKITITVLDTRR